MQGITNLRVVQRGYQLRFEKQGFDFKKDQGPAIAGWISKNRVDIWLNYLREEAIKDGKSILGFASDINRYFRIKERPEVNEDHINLYEQGSPIGWISREYRQQVENMLWNYLKYGDSVVEIEQTNEEEQLSLF
ncbi:hypothetical protein [Fuchsiella alkaliacetigena]|uniref:hypothetical protein n=1 Tax=Fuchsiella alkaliacetigena TaxID=957042 RepID=UPI00200A835F|nr:hypothetical protein [Fuchsiella alkaliacetigena]MCK8824713.1 hypothetical protein [Fuchsiella alkaliacetigena]